MVELKNALEKCMARLGLTTDAQDVASNLVHGWVHDLRHIHSNDIQDEAARGYFQIIEHYMTTDGSEKSSRQTEKAVNALKSLYARINDAS